jgi:hypothetical protein
MTEIGEPTRKGAASESTAQYGNLHGAPRSCRSDRHVDRIASVKESELADQGVIADRLSNGNPLRVCRGEQHVTEPLSDASRTRWAQRSKAEVSEREAQARRAFPKPGAAAGDSFSATRRSTHVEVPRGFRGSST